jgi:hypothetical protein
MFEQSMRCAIEEIFLKPLKLGVRYLILSLVLLPIMVLTLSLPSNAKADFPCGSPPPISDQAFKADAEAEANFLKKLVGAAGFRAEVENKTTEIFSKYPNGTYQDAYFIYIFCQILAVDKTMSTHEKLDSLTQFRRTVIDVRPVGPAQPPPRVTQPPPLPPVTQKPPPAPVARPPVGVVAPAPYLGGERWTITVGGEPLSIEFGVAPEYHVTMSSDRYGRQGKWFNIGSVAFQIDTNTHVISVWFVQNGAAQITSCGGFALPHGGGQSYTVTACHRDT